MGNGGGGGGHDGGGGGGGGVTGRPDGVTGRARVDPGGGGRLGLKGFFGRGGISGRVRCAGVKADSFKIFFDAFEKFLKQRWLGDEIFYFQLDRENLKIVMSRKSGFGIA